MDPIVQTGMRDGFIIYGTWACAHQYRKVQEINWIFMKKFIGEKLSVRQTEEIVKSLKEGTVTKPAKKKQLPKFVKESVKGMSEYFGHKIDVSVNSKGKGKISIPFHSEEDFNRIKNLLQ